MARAARGHFPKVLVNHVGYHPSGGKHVVVDGVRGARRFSVMDMRARGPEPAFSGKLAPGGRDLGRFLVGDFSELRRPGLYRVSVDGKYGIANDQGILTCWSHNFAIGDDVWDDPLAKLVHYYRVQSCGPSRYGYNTPCHVGDIARDDGGEAKPLTGGWHSAHDCSRTAVETMYAAFGLIGLAFARPDLVEVLELHHEMRWGNDCYLKTQDPAGFLYHGVGAPHYDQFMEYDWWDSASYMLGTAPASHLLQYSFISIQAQLARLFRERDPGYAARCLEAGKRCLEWTLQAKKDESCYALGTGVSACVHLFRSTGEERYRDLARKMADKLLALQAPEGYFRELREPIAETPPKDCPFVAERACYVHQALLGLVEAAEWLEDDPDRLRWMAGLERFADEYAGHFGEANAFGVLPMRSFEGTARQKARDWRELHYRYFLETNYWSGGMFWQAGDIAVRAGYGTCLARMAGLLGRPWLRQLAHRQLDWALGVNPFDSSMVWGVGRNQSPTYPSREMTPPVPDTDGAVYQGIGGDEDDNPLVAPGCYVTAEFWMPHQGSLLWLMAELSKI